MKEMKRNAVKGISIVCSGEEDVKCKLLDCMEKRNWRMKV
jgi:hypothetical protein